MAFAQNDVVQIVLQGATTGGMIVNTWYYRAATTPGGSQVLKDLAEAWRGIVGLKMFSALSTEYSCESIIANALSGGEIDTQYIYDATGQNGQVIGGTPLPEQMAISIRRKAAKRGRQYRGRIFLGPITDIYYQAGTPTNDYVDQSNVLLTQLRDAMKADVVATGTTWTPCLWHAATSTSDDVVTTSIGPLFVSHRSRRPGVGA